MTIQEFNYCKKVYDECVLDGLLIPDKLRQAYWYITGRQEDEPIVPIRKCKLTIFSFFQYHAAQVLADLEKLMDDQIDDSEFDSTETNLPEDSSTLSIDNDNSSHEETIHYTGVSHDGEDLQKQIDDLREQYKEAETNVKRSITMRIKAIEKKLEENGEL